MIKDLFTYKYKCSSEIGVTEFEECTLLQDIGVLKAGTECDVVIDILHSQIRFWVGYEDDGELVAYPFSLVIDSTNFVKPYWEL